MTELDGLVYSRDARYHSANYRCVMCFGHARMVEDDELKQAVFQEMTSRYFPGRTAGKIMRSRRNLISMRHPMLEMVIAQMSAKMREGGPKGPRDADEKASGTCGVAELRGHSSRG